MCLIIFAWKLHPGYPLLVSANRDEFYGRETAPLDWWEDAEIVGGRDLEGGGTWMGMHKSGKFSALTNYRDPFNMKKHAPTRGHLVSDYLRNGDRPDDYLADLAGKGGAFNGFNLLTGTRDELHYYSNYGEAPQVLEPGIYGLSNHLLDTPWPKVEKGKAGLKTLLEGGNISPESLIALLGDPSLAADEDLPSTGVPLEWERKLSAMFIEMPKYGTRVSTAVIMDKDGGVIIREKGFVPKGDREVRF